jgi:hypothetical protein
MFAAAGDHADLTACGEIVTTASHDHRVLDDERPESRENRVIRRAP